MILALLTLIGGVLTASCSKRIPTRGVDANAADADSSTSAPDAGADATVVRDASVGVDSSTACPALCPTVNAAFAQLGDSGSPCVEYTSPVDADAAFAGQQNRCYADGHRVRGRPISGGYQAQFVPPNSASATLTMAATASDLSLTDSTGTRVLHVAPADGGQLMVECDAKITTISLSKLKTCLAAARSANVCSPGACQ
jgi:hypothetical protein